LKKVIIDLFDDAKVQRDAHTHLTQAYAPPDVHPKTCGAGRVPLVYPSCASDWKGCHFPFTSRLPHGLRHTFRPSCLAIKSFCRNAVVCCWMLLSIDAAPAVVERVSPLEPRPARRRSRLQSSSFSAEEYGIAAVVFTIDHAPGLPVLGAAQCRSPPIPLSGCQLIGAGTGRVHL
jgi:hypothetical protein